jgi:hypothetical protein
MLVGPGLLQLPRKKQNLVVGSSSVWASYPIKIGETFENKRRVGAKKQTLTRIVFKIFENMYPSQHVLSCRLILEVT